MARRLLHLLACLLSVPIWAAEPVKPHVDKLIDPETQEAEIRRSIGWHQDRELTSYRLHWSPLFRGAPPLIVLAATSPVPREPPSSWAYPPVENPSQLFGEDRVADKSPGLSRPMLAPLRDAAIQVFDRNGDRPEAWRGTTSADGYLFDFNNDDNLDLAQIEWRTITIGGDDYTVSLVKITTIEAQPRILSRIVFNCRLSFVSETEDWGVFCETLDHTGCPILAFGPNQATTDRERHQFLVHWDAGKGGFEMLQTPEDETTRRHLRILDGNASLEDFIRQGGLGHPIRPAPSPPVETGPIIRNPYVFRSLKESSDQEMAAFFKGKSGKEAPRPSGPPGMPPPASDSAWSPPPPTKASPQTIDLPDHFWNDEPKEAALAFANANRSESARLRWLLAMDDRPPAAPPSSGWWHFDYSSGDLSNVVTIGVSVHFGVEKPCLLIGERAGPRFLGGDPLPGNPAYRLQIIPLSPAEARFLSDTLYWMDHIRAARTLSEATGDRPPESPPFEGSGTLECFENGKPPRKVASTSIQPLRDGFGRLDFITLTARLLLHHLPDHLQQQQRAGPAVKTWDPEFSSAKAMGRQKPNERKKQLQTVLRTIFHFPASDQPPPSILNKLITCAGDERITGLKPELASLQATLKPQTPEDLELAELERKFADPRFQFYAGDGDSPHAPLFERHAALTTKLEFDRSHLLHSALDKALWQLRSSGQPEALKEKAQGGGELARWALHVLRTEYPQTHAMALIGRFPTVGSDEQNEIFDFLAEHHPNQAHALIKRMTAEEFNRLLPEIANFERTHTADNGKQRIPELLKIVATHGEAESRYRAIGCLDKMQLDPAALAEFESLLLRELDEPQEIEHGPNYGRTTLAQALSALSRLPNAAKHIERIESLPPRKIGSLDELLEAVNRACSILPERDEHLLRVLKLRIEKQDTDMSRVFLAALAFDLRSFGPDAETFATDSSSVRDGYETHTFGPADRRYHTARIATALWKETNPETLARMWTALALVECYGGPGNKPGFISSLLEKRTKQALHDIPKQRRQPLVEALVTAVGANASNAATIAWLRKLVKEES